MIRNPTLIYQKSSVDSGDISVLEQSFARNFASIYTSSAYIDGIGKLANLNGSAKVVIMRGEDLENKSMREEFCEYVSQAQNNYGAAVFALRGDSKNDAWYTHLSKELGFQTLNVRTLDQFGTDRCQSRVDIEQIISAFS